MEIRGGGARRNKGDGVGHTPPPLSIRLYGAGVNAQGSEGFSILQNNHELCELRKESSHFRNGLGSLVVYHLMSLWG